MSGCPNCYDLGSAIVLTGNFFEVDNNQPGDPTTVTLRILDPDGIEQVVSPTKVSTGVYNYAFDATKPGVWYYRFEGLGGITAVTESNFVVSSSAFADAAA